MVIALEGRSPFTVGLNETLALVVCQFISARDASRLIATCKTGAFATAANSQGHWEVKAALYFGITSKDLDCLDLCKDVRDSWHSSFIKLAVTSATLGLPRTEQAPSKHSLPSARWLTLWSRIYGWLTTHLPSLAKSLRKPASPSVLEILKEQAGWEGLTEISPDVAGLWQVFDGQTTRVAKGFLPELELSGLNQDDLPWAEGLFGGYSAYEHEVSTVLLPLKAACSLTFFLKSSLPEDRRSEFAPLLAFACSFNVNRSQKMFFVDVLTGDVFASGLGRFTQAVPDITPRQQPDGLLRWMEEYASRLEDGVYSVRALRPEQEQLSVGICLFSSAGPDFSLCVTRGVEVTASCVYMPEHRQGWSYSISLRLLGTAGERGFETCQLYKRQWKIQAGDNDPEVVEGEGVIGLFPILEDAGWRVSRDSDPHGIYDQPPGLLPGPFRYQSCAGRNPWMYGTFGGRILMIPGTIKNPTGEPFWVDMTPFRLYVPDFLY